MLKLFKRLKKYIWMVLGDMLAVGCNVFTMMYLPKYMSSIVDEGVLVGNIEHIVTVGLKMLLISLMGACAIGAASMGTLAGILAAVGGMMFIASDALVCKGLIMSVDKAHHWITMGLYYGAQLFFAMAAAVGLK